MIQTDGGMLYGDWRSSAYGAARIAHLFTAGRRAACGARIAYAKTGARRTVRSRYLCYDCLAYGASGRPL